MSINSRLMKASAVPAGTTRGHAARFKRHDAPIAIQLAGMRRTERVRVALFTETFLPKVDGIVNTLCQLLEHLQSRGCESVLFAPSGGPDRYADTPVVGLPGVPFPLYPELRLGVPLQAVAQRVDAFKPDVVHVLNPLSLGVAGLRQARRMGVPAVASYHTDIAGFADHWGLGLLSPALWAFVRWVHGRADLNLCPSRATMEQLAQHNVPRLEVWSRGVDTQRFHPGHRSAQWRERLSAGEPERPLLLFVGRLSPEKRIDWLTDVLDTLPEARLAIVGDGPARPGLESLFAGRAAVFTGYLTGHDLASAYASADVFVFPGANETFGNAVLEAAASGLPVVAPQSGGIPDHVEDGVTGLLFDPNDREGLVWAVRRLVGVPQLARRLSLAGRRRAEGLTWPLVMDRLLSRYADLVDARNPRADMSA